MLILFVAFTLIFIRRLPDVQAEINLWLTVCILSQIIAIPLGLNYFTAGMLILIPMAIKYWRGRTTTLSEFLRGSLLSLPFIAVTSMPTRFLDAGRYYDQTIRWLVNGVPAGIANFDLYLLQMSGAHSMEAVITTFIDSGQNNFVSLLSTFLIVIAFLQSRKNNVFLLIALALLFLIGVHFAQTSAPGLLVYTLIFSLFFSIKKLSDIRSETLILVGTAIPLIKITAAPLSILAALELMRRKDFKGIAGLSIGGLLVLSKTIWTAGWIPGFGVLPLEWAIPKSAVELMKSAVNISKHQARGYYFNLFNFQIRWTAAIMAFIFWVFACIYITSKLKDYKTTLIKLITVIAVFTFWLFYYPQIRFILPFFIVILGLLYHENSRFNVNKKVVYLVWFLSLCTILPDFTPLMPNERAKHFFAYSGFKNINLIVPHRSWQLETATFTLDKNFTYYVPVENYHCYDSKFPCTRNQVKVFSDSTYYTPKFLPEKNRFIHVKCNQRETNLCK